MHVLYFSFCICVVYTELNHLLNDEFEAFIEDLKLSAVTSDFDDDIEEKGLYLSVSFAQTSSSPCIFCVLKQP